MPFACAITRDVVTVTGPDAATFLQGQLSQDVDALGVATSSWTFVLHPDGKVHTWARITKTAADAFVLDADPGAGQELEARLSRFLIRTKAELVVSQVGGFAVRGDAPRPDVAEGVLRLPLAGPRADGYDLLGDAATPPEGVAVVEPTVLEAHRIARGVPRAGRELDDRTIPAEVGQWIIDASVSFTKGCFVGQELVARIDSRGGNVPRHLRVIATGEPIEPGTPITADGPDATITSAADSPDHGWIGLAYLGRRVEPGATVVVGTASGVVHELPLLGPDVG